MHAPSRRRDTLFFLALATLAVLSAALMGCASITATESLRPSIWDAGKGRFVTESDLVNALSAVRFLLLGEVHDNPVHHVARARLITALVASGIRPAVLFEQFDLEHNAALERAQAEGADAEAIANAGGLDRKAWRWPLHKPIVEAALAAGLPVRASNLSRTRLRRDLDADVDKDTAAIWYARLHAAPWSEAQAKQLHADIVDSHCGEVPEGVVPRLVLAQRMRDAAMAQALVDAATVAGAILIAGNGHVRADLGVPVYLHAPGQRDASAPSLSIGFIEVNAEEGRAADFPQRVVAEHPGYGYLWFTTPAAREDPCADRSLAPQPRTQ